MHSGAGLGTELASGVGCWLAQSGTENQNPDFPIFSYAGEDIPIHNRSFLTGNQFGKFKNSPAFKEVIRFFLSGAISTKIAPVSVRIPEGIP